MRKILSLVLSLALSSLSLVSLAAPARAQQVASAGKSISEIREQYERLLAVDRDPATSADVKELNRKFLDERRTQLRTAIEGRLSALRKYHTSMGGALSAQESLVVENSIQALEKDLSALGAAQKPSSAPVAGATAPAARPRARLVGAAASPVSAVVNTPAPADFIASPATRSVAPPVVAADAPVDIKPLSPPTTGTEDTFDTSEIKLEITPSSVSTPINKVEVKVENAGKAIGSPQTISWSTTEFLPAPKAKSINVGLAAGDNVVTVTVIDPSGTYDPKTVTYKFTAPALTTAAAAPAAPAKTKMPRIDFIEAGSRRIRVFNLEPKANVKVKINGDEKIAQEAATSEAIFIVDPLSAGDIIEVTQTLNDQTSEGAIFEVTQGPLDPTSGGPFGILVGGAVISQQADAFQQADPFFGFLTGYTSKVYNARAKWMKCGTVAYREMFDGTFRDEEGYMVECREGVNGKKDGTLLYTTNGATFDQPATASGRTKNTQKKDALSTGPWAMRWNLRFQGMFQSAPRKAVATAVAGASPTPTPTPIAGGTCENNEPCFIASRKTFDIEMHTWLDMWANNSFSIGPYAAIGASSIMDDNELEGEAVPAPSPGGTNNNQAVTNAVSSNDLKKFMEIGAISNILLFDKKLFVQGIVGVGHYEALGGLYEGHNTKRRVLGKLRVFPAGLNRGFGRQVEAAPMFGVDLNAGRGPDHLKFFTGFAIRIRGFNIAGPQ